MFNFLFNRKEKVPMLTETWASKLLNHKISVRVEDITGVIDNVVGTVMKVEEKDSEFIFHLDNGRNLHITKVHSDFQMGRFSVMGTTKEGGPKDFFMYLSIA